jgi:hypothetical protein
MNLSTHPLFVSWRESLAIFAPSNLKVFTLIALKATVEAYKIFFTHFWWLFLGTIGLGMYVRATKGSSGLGFIFVMVIILWLLQIFLICLATRPSVQRKTYSYFMHYGWHLICFLFFCVIMLAIDMCMTVVQILTLSGRVRITSIDVVVHLLSIILVPLTFLGFWLYEGTVLIPLYITPFFLFWTFFLLDSPIGLRSIVKSLKNAIKMVIYNYPFCLISFGGLLGIYKIVFRVVEYMSIFICRLLLVHGGMNVSTIPIIQLKILVNIFVPLVMILFAPLAISFLSNFYIKRLHEQFLLYYPQKNQ